MFIKRLVVNQDIIKVNNNKLANKSSKHMIHQSHEGARCIGQTKWHYQPFIQPKLGFEGCFPFISFSHSDLVVATSQINFGENDSTAKLIKNIIKSRYGMSIPYGDVINGSAINTYFPRAIFFWN